MAIQTLHNAVKSIRNINRDITIALSRNTRCTAGRGYKNNGIGAYRARLACGEYARVRAAVAAVQASRVRVK